MKTYNTYTLEFAVVGRFDCRVVAESEQEALEKAYTYSVSELLDHLDFNEVCDALEVDHGSVDVIVHRKPPKAGDRYVCLVNNPLEADVKRGDVVVLVGDPDSDNGAVENLSMTGYQVEGGSRIWWGCFDHDAKFFLKLN